MSFIRPELQQRLEPLRYIWMELAASLVVGALGLALVWRGVQYGSWINAGIGVALVAVAGIVLMVAYRAAIIRRDPDAAGIVEVTERRITYLAPEQGGIVNLDNLTKLEILTTSGGPFLQDVFWVFWLRDEPTVMIPNNAEGSAKIFDVVDGLPGVSFAQIIVAMGSTDDARFTIWEAA